MAIVAPRPRSSFAMTGVARAVAAAALIVALIIGAAILLYVYAPHTTGSAVHWVKQAGSWLTSPFHNVVKIRPPMPFDLDDADRLVETFERVLAEDFG